MPAPNARMFPPGDGKRPTIKANGRTYTAALGQFLDVPTFDAHVLQGNGWVRAGGHAFVGPTSARPSPPVVDQLYLDTTLQAPVVWDVLAKIWRNVWTGAAA